MHYALNQDIERLTVRTGCGLLYDMSRISEGDRLYMGLEGHTEAESKEAMDPANINESQKIIQHAHCLKGTYPDIPAPMHDADFRHYQWQLSTVAPLYFEIRTSPLHTFIEFIQPLPKLAIIVKTANQKPDFRYALNNNVTYIKYPFKDTQALTVVVSRPISQTYQRIFDEATRMYYLYCESITRIEAMEKLYSRYGTHTR